MLDSTKWMAALIVVIVGAFFLMVQKNGDGFAKPTKPEAKLSQVLITSEIKAEVGTRSLSLHDIEQELVTYTNAERIKVSQHPLLIDQSLINSSRHQSIRMSQTGRLLHGLSDPRVAENIAQGQKTSVEVMASWMNSNGHRMNILSPNHKYIGVASYIDKNGTVWWTQQFK